MKGLKLFDNTQAWGLDIQSKVRFYPSQPHFHFLENYLSTLYLINPTL